MPSVAFHTLGCKVNQYDTQAMLECFVANDYTVNSFDEKSDVYVINTCTVTGLGEKKSLQTIRRAIKTNPDADIVVAGCLAQKDGKGLLDRGATLVVGTNRRHEVVELLHQAIANKTQICAVGDVRKILFERLNITKDETHTRAVMKIQEGCDRYCSFCIIPFVRGGLRSRPLEDIADESKRLFEAGYQEIVLTGIHLASYGKDLEEAVTLQHAIEHIDDRIKRIRLGSLEPLVVTEEFVKFLATRPAICPQFHLSLQSGCAETLRRMNRRYSPEQYFDAVSLLRKYFPTCAITTDIIAGFAGETQAEFDETFAFVKKVQFGRIHVFPYSERAGTKAVTLPNPIDKFIRSQRAKTLISLGHEMMDAYAKQFLNQEVSVLFEQCKNGKSHGVTPEYMNVSVEGEQNGIQQVRLLEWDNEKEQFSGEIVD